MDNKQSKILLSVLIFVWAFIVATAGHYVMTYVTDVLSFHMRWLLGFIFSTPPILALAFVGTLFKKKA